MSFEQEINSYSSKMDHRNSWTSRSTTSTTRGKSSLWGELQQTGRELVDTFRWRNIRGRGYPVWRKGDTDAFFALFSDNLCTQLFLVQTLITVVFQIPNTADELDLRAFPYQRLLPGLGISMLFGNLYYALQASKVAMNTGRKNTCALPYGINTPGAIAMLHSIFRVAYMSAREEGLSKIDAADKAWKVSVACNFVSGVFVILAAPVLPHLLRHVHSAILLTPVAGLGLAWLTLAQIILIMRQHPVVGLSSLLVVWYGTFGGGKFGRIPLGFMGMLLGVAAAWFVGLQTPEQVSRTIRFVGPTYDSNFFSWFAEIPNVGTYISLLVPIAATNALGTMECVRSAAESGDEYNAAETMIADGVGTIISALFGSPFGTTVYIGHAGYKRFGGGRGYSLLNGIVYFALGMTGLHSVIAAFVPFEAAASVIIFVGLCIAKQTLELGPMAWTPAILVGSLFAFSDLAYTTTNRFNDPLSWLGGYSMKNGYLFTSFLWTLALVAVTDRKLIHAAGYWALCAILAAFGFIHAKEIGIMDSTGSLDNICAEKNSTTCTSVPICTFDDTCKMLAPGLPGYRMVLAYGVLAVMCTLGYVCQLLQWTEGPVLDTNETDETDSTLVL